MNNVAINTTINRVTDTAYIWNTDSQAPPTKPIESVHSPVIGALQLVFNFLESFKLDFEWG